METTPDLDPLLLSHSRLTTFSSCPEKFRLLYLTEGVAEIPQGGFIGGIAVHETIEWCEREGDPLEPSYYEDQGPAVLKLREFVDRFVDEAGGDEAVRWSKRGKGEDRAWWHTFGAGMLRNYHGMRMSDEAMGWKVVPSLIEANLTLPLEGERLLRGRLDAVLETPTGLVIRDYKTGASSTFAVLQLALYARMVEDLIGTPVQGGELSYVRTNKILPYTDLQRYIEPAYTWVDQISAAIRAENYYMVPSNFCVACSVKPYCAWGSTLPADKEASA